MTNDRLFQVQTNGSRTNGVLDAFVFLLRLSMDETNARYQSPPPVETAGDTHKTSPVGGGDDGHATGSHNKVGEPMYDKGAEG